MSDIPPKDKTAVAQAAVEAVQAEVPEISSERFLEFNELSAKWLGACGLNPFHIYDSSARLQMFSQHLGQMLSIAGRTPRLLQTGMERQYGKFTYKVDMPCNGKILDIIPRYTQKMSSDSVLNNIEDNPQVVVVYEDDETREVGIIDLATYCSNHQYFGFRYQKMPGLAQLQVNAFIPKGTVFLDSPAITPEGDYAFGVQANVAFMSHPATSEDGVAVSDRFLKRLGYCTFETRTVEWGKKRFALNLYGNKDHYKPFPDIGDRIREDGLLMALRDYEPSELAIVEQNVNSCMRVDYTFDDTIYANGAGGKVIDIRIHHDKADQNTATVHMDSQPQKYDKGRREFYERIMNLYLQLKKIQGETLRITPQFHQLVVQAQSVISEGGKTRVTKLYRKAPLDTYRIEFVIQYDMLPNMGSKITDNHGGKGVMCQIIPHDQMPVDEDGNVADIIMDGNATINRANPGRLIEQYYNAAARDAWKRLAKMLNVTPQVERPMETLNKIRSVTAEQLQSAWDYLYGFYRIVSPEMAKWWDDGLMGSDKAEFIADALHRGMTKFDHEVTLHGLGLYIPTDHQSSAQDVVALLEKLPQYRPVMGPVSYVGNSGVRVTTVKPIRVAGLYVIMLEKTGDDWSAVSSGKLQLFGVLSQLTKNDKYSRPNRPQAVRVMGEGEIRISLANCGELFTAEIMDRNNNPLAHQLMVGGILSADFPGNIENLIDRNLVPHGGSKALQLFKHMCEVSGFRIEYQPHDVNAPKIT